MFTRRDCHDNVFNMYGESCETCWNFGSQNHFKSDLLRLWSARTAADFCGCFPYYFTALSLLLRTEPVMQLTLVLWGHSLLCYEPVMQLNRALSFVLRTHFQGLCYEPVMRLTLSLRGHSLLSYKPVCSWPGHSPLCYEPICQAIIGHPLSRCQPVMQLRVMPAKNYCSGTFHGAGVVVELIGKGSRVRVLHDDGFERYVCVYNYVYTCIHIYIPEYIYVYLYIYLYIHTHSHALVCTQMYVRIHLYV